MIKSRSITVLQNPRHGILHLQTALPVPSYRVAQVLSSQAGLRVDTFLASEQLSRSAVQRLLAEGNVRIDGVALRKSSRRVQVGEVVAVKLPLPEPSSLKAECIPLKVLFEDNNLMVINKPKGMVVHPAPGNPSGTLVNALLHHCGDSLSGVGGVRRPGVVHRLDKDTSGAIVVAKNDAAHHHLAAQIKQHAVRRVYVALVHGLPPTKGKIDAPIGRHPVRRMEMAVTPQGRSAVTHFRLLEQLGQFSLVEVRLETGRTHQIRVHMAYAGYPVVGDPVYSGRRERILSDGQALHAWQISFTHPALGVDMTCVAELPKSFVEALEHLRQRAAAKMA